MITKADIRAAIYTEDRQLWLDPEDLDEMVDDVYKAIAKDLDETLRAIGRANRTERNGYVGF